MVEGGLPFECRPAKRLRACYNIDATLTHCCHTLKRAIALPHNTSGLISSAPSYRMERYTMPFDIALGATPLVTTTRLRAAITSLTHRRDKIYAIRDTIVTA